MWRTPCRLYEAEGASAQQSYVNPHKRFMNGGTNMEVFLKNGMFRRQRRFLRLFSLLALAFICFPIGVHAEEGLEPPDGDVELATLSNCFQPVSFYHAMHAEVADCAVCHHHTTGIPNKDEKCSGCHKDGIPPAEVACSGCHPKRETTFAPAAGDPGGRHHVRRTGLKRAYHVKCMGCHQQMGAPTGCKDCHAQVAVRVKQRSLDG